MRPKKTVLLVDDDDIALSVYVFLLTTKGFRVIASTDPAAALKLLARTANGAIDVLVAKLLLPKMDGNELARRARRYHPDLPTLLFSKVVNSFDRALNANIFLPKGFNNAEMVERIRILAARKRGPKKQLAAAVYLPEAEARVGA